MENIKELYNNKLKYNCSYYESKSESKSNYLIIFLGSRDFLITSNYWGVVAVGCRSYDYDKEQANYIYACTGGEHIPASRVEQIIKQYEYKRLNNKKINITKGE